MKILFCGDIFLNTPDQSFVFDKNLEKIFQECQFRIGNFEAPLLSDSDQKPLLKAGPAIFQDPGVINFLKEKFTHLSLANNHVFDYGVSNYLFTKNTLNENGLQTFGVGKNSQECFSPLLLESGVVKVAVFAIAEAQFGYFHIEGQHGFAWFGHADFLRYLSEYKRKVDHVIIFVHAGLELFELPLPEFRDLYKLWIDFGADLIIGTHPHLIQGKELYNNKWIYYSLGNFLFSPITNKETNDWFTGLLLECRINKDSIEIVDHRTIFNQAKETVEIIDGFSFENNNDFMMRNKMLENNIEVIHQYNSKVDSHINNIWNNIYKYYYAYKVPKRGIKNNAIEIIRKKMHQKYFDHLHENNSDVMIFHNIKIETHRFVVERYIQNKYYRNGWV